jgi:superoxide reductase
MAEMKDLFQTADWKAEKHVPVIDFQEGSYVPGDTLSVNVSVGKSIPHPNTTAHHIRWIEVYFLPDGAKFPFQLARAEFTAHGESVEGADMSTTYTAPSMSVSFKTSKSGTIFASAYCNIHGLWQSSQTLKIA